MYYFFTDETNKTPDSIVKFFVYGGLIVPVENFEGLHDSIKNTREKFGFEPEDSLKFDTNSRPVHVTREQSTIAKNLIIRACLENKCKFIVSVTHHGVAKSTGIDQTIDWATDCVLKKFNDFLLQHNGWGIFVRDRLPEAQQYNFLSEKFTKGLIYPGGNIVSLERIKLFTSSCNNASHMSSAVDIALGAFRYCINNPQNENVTKVMMTQIAQMLWAEREGDRIYAFEKGLSFRPPVELIKVPQYKQDCEDLIENINRLIK